MSKKYYQEELAKLKELGAEFAATHPALAPMLGGPSADPDVERLLEGVAFQTGLLREKLDDDFPELIHDLARLVCPQYLQPVPAATMIAFTPGPALAQSQKIPAGTELASVPVEGVSCRFRTCSAIELHPLELRDAVYGQPSGQPAAVSLFLSLQNITLSDWNPKSLRLFLAGEYAHAADLYFLLRRHLRRIVLNPAEGGRPAVLPPECLQPVGFREDEALIPYPPQAFPGYRLLQEYFTAPAKFLMLDLTGWERWDCRGAGAAFRIDFELAPFTLPPPRVRRESFMLSVTPAVNLFECDAEPVLLDHRRERYPVRPAGLSPEQAQVFAVNEVTGFIRGTARKRDYQPFELFRQATPTEPTYHTATVRSAVRQEAEVMLSVAYPPGSALPEAETLSLGLTCTNGSLPERLRIGDVCRSTGSSPGFASYRNITPATAPVQPRLGKNLLWRLLSHLALNRLSLATAENLQALLGLYLDEECTDRAALAANRRRIEGIDGIEEVPEDRLLRGCPVRGREIRLRLRGDHFAGTGDLFLFCSILDAFLESHASLNTFTRLTVHEVTRGDRYQWPPRLGHEQLS